MAAAVTKVSRAIALNDSAVDLLRRGEHQVALLLFDTALCELSQGPVDVDDPTASAGGSSDDMDCDHASGTVESSSSPGNNMHTGRCVLVQSRNADHPERSSVGAAEIIDPEGSPSNQFVLYNRVFAIVDNHNHQPARADLARLSRYLGCLPPILLYNMGFTFHKLALRHGDSVYYEKALQLYSLSQKLLESCAFCWLPDGDLACVAMALCNNMGHIQSHFLRSDEANLCLLHLHAILFHSKSSTRLSAEECIFFYVNTLLALPHQTIFAPAA